MLALWGKASDCVNGKVCLQARVATRSAQDLFFANNHDELEVSPHFLIFEKFRVEGMSAPLVMVSPCLPSGLPSGVS